MRIVKPPPPPSSPSAGPTAPLAQPRQVAAGTISNLTTGLSYVPTPEDDCSGGLRMATIQEDNSSDSHLGEEAVRPDEFPTAEASLSATKSSYEDLSDHSPSAGERRRLKRQECFDGKETEC